MLDQNHRTPCRIKLYPSLHALAEGESCYSRVRVPNGPGVLRTLSIAVILIQEFRA